MSVCERTGSEERTIARERVYARVAIGARDVHDFGCCARYKQSMHSFYYIM